MNQFLTLCLLFSFPSTLSMFKDFLLDFLAATDDGYGGRSLMGGGLEVVSLEAKRFLRIGDLGGIGGTWIFVTC